MDSMLEATALPTTPQSLPMIYFYQKIVKFKTYLQRFKHSNIFDEI